MRSIPPTPEIGLLQTPLPDLAMLAPGDPAWRFSRAEREARSGKGGGAMSIVEAAGLARDLGQFAIAIEKSNEALRAAVREGSIQAAAHALAVHTSALVLVGDFRTANEMSEQLRSFAAEDASGALDALYRETSAALWLRTAVQDWFEGARRLLEGALEGYRRVGDPLGEMRACAATASVLSGYGAYLDAVDHVDRGLKIAAANEDWRYVGRLLLEAALALRDQGYRHNVAELFKLSIAWSVFVGDEPARIRGLHGLAYLLDFEADPQNAEDQERSETVFLEAIDAALAIGALPLALEARSDLVHLYRKFDNAEGVARQQELAKQDSTRVALSSAPKWLEYQEDYRQFVETHRQDRNLVRFREGIEGVAEPFFIFDPILRPDGTCEDLLNEFRNSAADQLLGYGPASVRTLADLMLTPHLQGLKEPLLRAVTDRESYADEISTVDASGATAWFSRRIVPAGDGAVLTLRNSTDSRNVQEALRTAAERARQADRAKSEFLANMSHEVRTPINGVLGLARLLADSELDSEQRVYVQGIISSGDVLLRVIGDVLDVSKIEAQSMAVDPQPTEVHELVAEVVRLYRGQAAEKEIELRGMVEVDVPKTVLLDGPRLRQILGNLVGNAVKFTSMGWVQVVLRRKGESLEFEVQDSGVGIPEDRLEAIFAPFQQAGKSEGGTGLGLTISKRLVELMGGDMTVKSQIGVGSRFSFRLPLRTVDEAVAETPPTRKSVRFESKRVLLVEDNEVNVLVAKGLLRKLGCSVSTAANGADSLKRLARGHFDAILMDVRMPVMDGLEATREIRRREAADGAPRVPIIALTAGTLTDERDECFEAGMDDYLAKPFTLDSLSSTMSRWLHTDEASAV
jgi:signal transduction histidine kinase/CheY-like chemotaxis protein